MGKTSRDDAGRRPSQVHESSTDVASPPPSVSPVDRAPIALTVAGSDSGGGAGVGADLKTMEALDTFGTSAVTAVTAQNTTGVSAVTPVPHETVREQVAAVAEDLPVAAAKTGMLVDGETVRAVTDAFREWGVGRDAPLVVDPVVLAESGDRLLEPGGVDALRERLLPEATLVTPNRPEANLLVGRPVTDTTDAAAAARALRNLGADAALVTGGHVDGAGAGDDTEDGDSDGADRVERVGNDEPVSAVVDVLATADGVRRFRRPRVDTDATHGSGCTLSAAITARLARGDDLETAVETGARFVDRAVRFARADLGAGAGPVNHAATLRSRAGVAGALAAVDDAVRSFERTPAAARLVPEVGLQFAVAPPCALDPEEVAAVDGRLHRVGGGDGRADPSTVAVRATGSARLGASDHLARLLLGVREADPTVRAVCNVRRDEETVDAVEERFETVRVDRREEPSHAPGTMDWVAATALAGRGRAPAAIVGDGDHGKEPMVRLLGREPSKLRERAVGVARALDD